MDETDLLRELHEGYIWKVNAAVEEGRMDLVWQLSDEYTDEALQLMTTMHSPGCERPECTVCARAGSMPSVPGRRRRFWRRHPGAR